MAYKRSRHTFEADLQKRESQSPWIVYGTPLPPIDGDARDDGSYLPVWKQEVTDDRGRKRLHGAFTGGFSAGYFNTVGSKEGWTPSTFVSSRSNRAKDGKSAVQMKPEDFMDEEDIREQEESRVLSTSEAYAGFGTEHDPMQRDALTDLLRPADDSMGNKLLNKMGWKPGQGIGPRVKRRIDPDDDSSESRAFAPEDVPMISFKKKNDTKGLGYHSEAVSMTTTSKSASEVMQSEVDLEGDDDARPGLSFMKKKSKKSVTKPSKAAFGVGILNDTGSDDEDPYSMGPKISYNRTLGSDNTVKKTKKKGASAVGMANPLLRNTPTFVSKRLASIQQAFRKCHDGRLPLNGFVLADELDSFSSMSLSDEKYKPPEVPPDWKPLRAAEVDVGPDDQGPQQSTTFKSSAEAAKQFSHTSASRGALLGEEKLPGKSVFDYLTPAAREKLMKATGRTDFPPALSEHISGDKSGSSRPTNDPGIELPFLDPITAKSALSRAENGGFMPYAENLEKRARYKYFLEIAAGIQPEGTLPLRPPVPAGTDDWKNELYEFVRAAEVFRPMTGAIASRFTTSSTMSMSNSSTEKGSTSGEQDLKNVIRQPLTKPEDPAEIAAKLGMFGMMTRSTSSFQPTRLVCKRFGVEMPTYMPQEAESHATATSQGPAGRFASAGFITQGEDHSAQSNQGVQQASKPQATATATATTRSDEQATGDELLSVSSMAAVATVIDPDRNEALEAHRPGQEVFKAIFGDSDDDSDS